MISLSSICMLLSVGCLFAVSKKVEREKVGLLLQLANRPQLAKGIALLLFIMGLFLLEVKFGLTNGIIIGFVLWTMFASLFVLIAPFKQVKGIHIGSLAALSILLELLFL